MEEYPVFFTAQSFPATLKDLNVLILGTEYTRLWLIPSMTRDYDKRLALAVD
jgi:hypothetical protein